MTNLTVHFAHPWLLLLFIPALIFALVPHFKIAKKYRRTRNRVISLVLHILVITCAIFASSGLTFAYQIENDKNEIILLVDVSDTEEQAAETRDALVRTVLEYGKFDNYNVGIVTFGYTQNYAVPLTRDVRSIFAAYQTALLPDTSATNIAAALEFTKELFHYPETAKIVLISDGKETDERAQDVIRSVAAMGIKVDTAYVPSVFEEADVQVVEIKTPDYHVGIDEKCAITVTLRSDFEGSANVTLYDNGVSVKSGNQRMDMSAGTHILSFEHVFETDGLHKLTVEVETEDGLAENNIYSSYLYMEIFNKVLIIDRGENYSDPLKALLEEGEEFAVTTLDIRFAEDVPASVDALREYDQIILNNIANADMPEGFDELLESYVNEYGGGLFTVGGDDELGAHAYNRSDMYGTLYQKMLPVQAIDYTPPLGVMIIIDTSGSMAGTSGGNTTKLKWARAGATACLDAMTERDHIGIMTLDDTYSTILPMTSRTQYQKIVDAINTIEETNGGTVFANAIDRAGKALRATASVDRRHIVIVTDGGVTEGDPKYLEYTKNFYEMDGTTLSVVQIGSDGNAKMQELVEAGHGRFYAIEDSAMDELVRVMAEDLRVPEIKEFNPEPFNPLVKKTNSPLVEGLEIKTDAETGVRLNLTLDGVYGVKVRESADLILTGDYEVPLYAQWKYGKGTVGSFMCDLNGTWSSSFMAAVDGRQFIKNVVGNLMPMENIRTNEIRVDLDEDNYTNKMSVYTQLSEGQYITGTLISSSGESISLNESTTETGSALNALDAYVTLALNAANNYTRCNFTVKVDGIYTIILEKRNQDGSIVSSYTTYKKFSYSEEYDRFVDVTEPQLKEMLAELSDKTNGSAVIDLEDPIEVFSGFVTHLDLVEDPRLVLMIVAMVAFLLDIAVRKFKFKWIHEIIREHKEKKNKK